MSDPSDPLPSAKRVLSPAERRERNRAEMIAAILDAARAVMREEGVAALNLQRVAEGVGIRAPSLYTYFPSKVAIYEALYVLGMRMYRERIERAMGQEYGNVWEALQAALTTYMQFAQENPELYQLVFERPVPKFVPSDEGNAEARKLIEGSIGTLQRFVDAGEIATGLPSDQASLLFVAMMHGLTSMYMANEPDVPIRESRFGGLIPAVMGLLKAGWGTTDRDD